MLVKRITALGAFLCLFSHGGIAAPVSGQGTWETTLQGRDLDGNAATYEAYYDTVLDITWLADANYAQTSGFDADGQMTWDQAQSWIASLNSGNHLGIGSWRLPTMLDTGTPGCNASTTGGTDCGYHVQTVAGSTVYSEMATMFYLTLDNIAFYDTLGNPNQPGWGLSNTGPFANLQAFLYWSGLEDATSSGQAWFNSFTGGRQDVMLKTDLHYAWAVTSGDVALVPVPAALWLFAGGLFGLLVPALRKR